METSKKGEIVCGGETNVGAGSLLKNIKEKETNQEPATAVRTKGGGHLTRTSGRRGKGLSSGSKTQKRTVR